MKLISRIAPIILLAALPFIGIAIAGRDIKGYCEFPPLTRYVEHAGFSWPVFIGIAAFILVCTVPLDRRVLKARIGIIEDKPAGRFPIWGFPGIILMLAGWILAWTRFPVMAPLQIFTFTPHWVGYIITVNALTQWRRGSCMITARPGVFALLFVVSAAFWWYFEILNRFVQNWYYIGTEGLSPLKYFIFATIPFSTVLPAVLGTYELLSSYKSTSAGLIGLKPLVLAKDRRLSAIVLALSCISLCLLGIYPDILFPMLWLSPLLVLTSIKVLKREKTLLDDIASGDWSRIYRLALASLICGLFWEMWNQYSLAKWIYTVPYVGGFKIFEMPLLGFAGYLPFGLECFIIAEWFTGEGDGQAVK